MATIVTNNNNIEIRVNEALLLHKNGQYLDAIKAYESLLPLVPHKLASSLYSNLGAINLQAGDYTKAKENFSNSVDALPENSVAHYNLAIILTTKFNEHKKALIHSKKALNLDPNNHKIVHLLGNILQNLGQNDEAERYFIKAEEMVMQYDVGSNNIVKKDLSILNIMKAKIGDTINVEMNGVTYNMNCISERPLLFKLPNFLNKDECSHIIMRANNSLEKSFVMGGNKDIDEPYRSSFNSWLSRDEQLENILHRLEQLTSIPISYLMQKSEELQVVKYENKGQFKLHHDSSNFHKRLFTLLLYLNDVTEDSGGETYFPYTGYHRPFDLTVEEAISNGFTLHQEKAGTFCKPHLGDAILFFNYNIDGTLDSSSVHAGLPLNNNETNKWIANYWVDYDIDLLLNLIK